MKLAKLGSGKRFAAVEKNAAEHGASDPAAVAASIGMKKWGEGQDAGHGGCGTEETCGLIADHSSPR